jgi:cellulose synthase/poly-beta-1,6-N-acetylglucosamine synthase-like glycosyltransferase
LIKKGDCFPTVTLIIPAYNEEKVIQDKIQNCLSLDYPKDKLEIVVASDGSTDRTSELVRQYLSQGVSLLEYHSREGKISLLNKCVPCARNEIIAFSDASGMLDKDSLKELVRNFNDPKVGCACGLYIIVMEENSLSARGYHAYIEYDVNIKKSESRFSTILGAHGAFYAIRKELFEPFPQGLINDDFFLPMKVVAKGYRVVYEEKAVVTDKMRYSFREEFRRRTRIGFGNWQQIFKLKELLGFSRGLVAWQFFSHKVIRTIAPLCFIFTFILTFILTGLIYNIFFWLFVLLFSFTLIGALLQLMKFPTRFIYLPFFLVMANIAYLVGAFKFFFQPKKLRW